MAYSIEYKERATAYKQEGHTFKQLREAFGIPCETYYDWEEKPGNGYCQTKAKQERGRKDKEVLKWAAAVFYDIENLGMTRKKDLCLLRKTGKAMGRVYRKVKESSRENLIYVGERGENIWLQREYARTPLGEQTEDVKRGSKFERENVIGAQRGGEPLAVECYTRMTNSGFFEQWFAGCLLAGIPK